MGFQKYIPEHVHKQRTEEIRRVQIKGGLGHQLEGGAFRESLFPQMNLKGRDFHVSCISLHSHGAFLKALRIFYFGIEETFMH
jgi:hypothetical protein